MDEREARALLGHLDRRMAEEGFGELNGALLAATADSATASDRVLRYLDGFRTHIALQSEETVARTIQRFRVLGGESTQGFDRISVAIEPTEVGLYGSEQVEITGEPGLESILAALSGLRRDLQDRDVGIS